MRKIVVWLGGAALVIVAGAVTVITPGVGAQTDAFPIHGVVDEAIRSRNLMVRIEDVRFADRITVPDDQWAAEGNWLVVDLSVSAPRTEFDAELRLIKLIIGGREYIASERPSTSLVGVDLRVGLETSGMVAFELPADLDAEPAELRLSPPHSTPHLDDVIVVPVDLSRAQRESVIEIVEPMSPGAP